MDSLTIQEKVLSVVKKVSGGKVTQVDWDSDLKNGLALDSVQLVELFALLEHDFDTELPLQLMTVRTAKDFFDLLEETLKK